MLEQGERGGREVGQRGNDGGGTKAGSCFGNALWTVCRAEMAKWPDSTLVPKMCGRRTSQGWCPGFGPRVVRMKFPLTLIGHIWNSVLDTMLVKLLSI